MHNTEVPFAGLLNMRVKHKILTGERPDRPDGIDDTLWRIIQGCWQHDPDARLTSEVLGSQLRRLCGLSGLCKAS